MNRKGVVTIVKEHDLSQEIQDVLNLTKPDAFEPDAPFYLVASRWLCELGDAVHAAAEHWRNDDLDAFIAPATDAALHVWDTVIAPYDIPRVPAFIERQIEAPIRATIPGLVAEAFERARNG